MNVSSLVKPHVAENPEKTAILFGNLRISYGELDRLINRVASGLQNMGYTRGDVVSIFLPSIPKLKIWLSWAFPMT